MKSMIVAGVMSGTSADGVDVAFVRISPPAAGTETPRLKVLGHRSFPYPPAVRGAVLATMSTEPQRVRDFARLHWRLGELYGECVAKTSDALGVKPALVGMHGQTVYHQGEPETYLGKPVRVTLQIGEAAKVVARLGVPVVSDFRPADMAAGGQGAPLVPMLDYCLFRHPKKSRVLLNLGGIANVTAIPAGGAIGDLLAFDTGPANMVVDELMQRAFGKPFDRGGKMAARGELVPEALKELLRDPYFQAAPPKSCGREQFGRAYADRLVDLCAGKPPEDILATATELTVASIRDAYARFCWPHLGQRAPLARTDLIAAGGGVRNATLMRRLGEEFGALGVKVLAAEDLGLAAQAKEAVAFALLGWLTFHGLPGNVPSATGAARAVVLGKISR